MGFITGVSVASFSLWRHLKYDKLVTLLNTEIPVYLDNLCLHSATIGFQVMAREGYEVKPPTGLPATHSMITAIMMGNRVSMNRPAAKHGVNAGATHGGSHSSSSHTLHA